MRIWTADLLRARQLLYQLSYSPLSRPDLYRVGFRADVIHPEAHWLCISLMRRMDLNHRPPGYEPGKLTMLLYSAIPMWLLYHIFLSRSNFFQHFSISESSGYLSIHANIIPENFWSFQLFFVVNTGFEPVTATLWVSCSTNWANWPMFFLKWINTAELKEYFLQHFFEHHVITLNR